MKTLILQIFLMSCIIAAFVIPGIILEVFL